MTVLSQLEKGLERRMIESGMDVQRVKRELSFANQTVMRSEQLKKCDKHSLGAAVVNIANVGLTLNPVSQEAALIARYKKGKYEAVLMPMYQGLVKLLMSQGSVISIITQLVYENDTIEFDLSSSIEPVKKHSPELIKSKRGKILGAYSVATLKSGVKQMEWMDIEEIYGIRNQSDSWKNENGRKYSPWFNFEGEMIRKTVLKRITKYLPKADTEGQKLLDRAIYVDNNDYPASFKQINYIESLLVSANISPEKSRDIHANFEHYNKHEAESVIRFLEQNQQTDIRFTGVGNMTQTAQGVKTAVANPNT